MKVSIVTPCFNAEAYIAETITSVLSQGGDFFIEYIIIDGASSDKTLSVINSVLTKFERESSLIHCLGLDVTLISKADTGMYQALGKGFSLVSGDIVAYINASDVYFPGAFTAVVSAFHGNDIVNWVTGWNTWMNSNGVLYNNLLPFGYVSKYIREYLYNGKDLPHIQQESTFWRSAVLSAISYEKLVSFKYAGDFYLWYCLSKKDDLYVLHAQLACFRAHAGQASENLEHYDREVSTLIGGRRFFDSLNGLKILHKLLWMLPPRFKKRLSSRMIY
jgi:glycosyltransferase involved in cell wall biosynthesis